QAELCVIRDSQSVVVVIRLDHREHRSEYFFLLDCRTCLHVGDDGWFNKKSLLSIRSTTSYDPAAFGLSFLNITVDCLEGLFVNDRAHRVAVVRRIAEFDLRSPLSNLLDHRLIHPSV